MLQNYSIGDHFPHSLDSPIPSSYSFITFSPSHLQHEPIQFNLWIYERASSASLLNWLTMLSFRGIMNLEKYYYNNIFIIICGQSCRSPSYHLSLTIFLSSAECCFLRLANSRLSSNSLGALWRWVVVIVITIIIIKMIIIINIIIIITIIHAFLNVSIINIGASQLPLHGSTPPCLLDYIFFLYNKLFWICFPFL